MSFSNDNNDRQDQTVVWTMLIGVVTLACGLAVGVGLSRTGSAQHDHAHHAHAAHGLHATLGAQNTHENNTLTTDASAQPMDGDQAPIGLPTEVAQSAAQETAAANGDAAVVVENGVVKFYFASGSAALAAGANEALADVVRATADGRRAIISGYHDATGSAALNAELSKKRAFAVRDALLALGVAETSLELRKPEVTLANTANDPQARRVEVTLE